MSYYEDDDEDEDDWFGNWIMIYIVVLWLTIFIATLIK